MRSQIEDFIGEEEHVIFGFSKSKAGINEAVVLQHHNGFIMKKCCENGVYDVEEEIS